jgi:hypothetical protein
MAKTVRIQVRISPAVAAAMNRINELTGEPKSTILGDMLDAVAPIFADQIEALEKLASTPDQARDYVMQMGAQGINAISQQMLDLPPAKRKPGRPRRYAP